MNADVVVTSENAAEVVFVGHAGQI